MNRAQQFLLLSAIILIPIGLTYGSIPNGSMKALFGLEINAADRSIVHMLRGFAGLYCAMGLFWASAALRKSLVQPALWSVAIFMLGVASGRVVSFIVDGVPSFWGFSFFLVSELLLAVVAIYFLRNSAS